MSLLFFWYFGFSLVTKNPKTPKNPLEIAFLEENFKGGMGFFVSLSKTKNISYKISLAF